MQPFEIKQKNHVSYGEAFFYMKNGRFFASCRKPVGNVTSCKNKYLGRPFPTFPTVSYGKSHAREPAVGNVGNTYRFPTFRRPAENQLSVKGRMQ